MSRSWAEFLGDDSEPAAEEEGERTGWFGRLRESLATSRRALAVYGSPGRASEMTARIARARQWLLAATPVTSEERNMRLMALVWSKAPQPEINAAVRQITSRQRADGGWAQRDARP